MMTPAFFKRHVLTRILWSFRREFAVVGMLSLVANVLMLSPTLYMLQIYDRVLRSQSELTLLMISLIIFTFLAVMSGAEWIRSRLLVRAGVRFDDALNDRIFRAGFRAELEQSGHNPGQALSDLANIRQFLTGNGIIAFFDAPWTPIYIAVMFMLHPLLGWLSIFFVVNLVILAIVGQRRTAKLAGEVSAAEVEVNTYLYSKLRNSEVIESMGMLGDLRRRWAIRHRNHLRVQSRTQGVGRSMTAVVKFLRYTQQSLSLGAAALLAINGEISIGAMIAANVLMSRASAPMEVIVSTWSSFQSARAAFERLGSLLDAHPEKPSGNLVLPPTGQVRLRGIVATAPKRAEPILKTLDTEFPAGQFTAIIGPSGSGKSTLARTLIGIWPYTQGQVLFDGHPLHTWDRAALGSAIGYLPQDIELFEGTIADNIARFGDVDAAKVIDAAQRTGMHEMILRMPNGYDTPIGDGGSFLSGGQRQRIGLARALYGDPSVIVLDEPNANLDEAGEAALIKAVADLKARGRTVFVITHRLNVLTIADRILVLNNGVVQVDGPRDKVIGALRGPGREPPGNPSMAYQPA